MTLILPTNSVTGGFEVANSCRFDKPSGSYLTKTFSGAGNTRTFTFSTWLKGHDTGVHGSSYFFVGNISGSSNIDAFGVTDSGIQISVNSATAGSLNSKAVFRDFSAWYHMVIAVDTTQSTAANRIKVYVNGSQITAWDTETYPTQNYDFTGINSTEPHDVSYRDSEHNGYLAESVFIDGLQLGADSFGEFDEDSPTIWKPINVSGLTFGTNGFYLDYKDSSALGNDVSGNNNDFTSSGLAAIDQSTDSPTNNFATLNPLLPHAAGGYSMTYSEGNNTIVFGNVNESTYTSSTIGVSSGKWYFETKITTVGSGFNGGAMALSSININQTSGAFDDYVGKNTNDVGYQFNGEIAKNNSSVQSSLSSVGAGDILGVAMDLDNNTIQFYVNGSSSGSAVSLLADETYFFAFSGRNSAKVDCNFGSPAFSISSGNSDGNGYGNMEYSVPSGYYTLCTKNLAEYG